MSVFTRLEDALEGHVTVCARVGGLFSRFIACDTELMGMVPCDEHTEDVLVRHAGLCEEMSEAITDMHASLVLQQSLIQELAEALKH